MWKWLIDCAVLALVTRKGCLSFFPSNCPVCSEMYSQCIQAVRSEGAKSIGHMETQKNKKWVTVRGWLTWPWRQSATMSSVNQWLRKCVEQIQGQTCSLRVKEANDVRPVWVTAFKNQKSQGLMVGGTDVPVHIEYILPCWDFLFWLCSEWNRWCPPVLMTVGLSLILGFQMPIS